MHPTNKVLTEDVYYMHLLYRQLRHEPLTMLQMSLSEFRVERAKRGKALRRAAVYHKLKYPQRFAYVRERPSLLQPREREHPSERFRSTGRKCGPLASRYTGVAKVDHCCKQWTWCFA